MNDDSFLIANRNYVQLIIIYYRYIGQVGNPDYKTDTQESDSVTKDI